METAYMDQEKEVPDALDLLIGERLGERQMKLQRMEEMERLSKQKSPVAKRAAWTALLAAACVAALLVFSPFSSSNVSPWDELGYDSPRLTDYRAASAETTEINQLIESGDFSQAVPLVAEALRRSDNAVEIAMDAADAWPEDESVQYEEELERKHNSELRWTYIYLLMKTEHYKEARKQLKRYLKAADYCEHESEARSLLEKK